MERLAIFELIPHGGAYENWPRNTELTLNGQNTGIKIPGYYIEAQYRTAIGFLLITSWDCPFEEGNEFLLLDRNLKTIDRISLVPWFDTFFMENNFPISDRSLKIEYSGGSKYLLEVVERKEHDFHLQLFCIE